MKQGWFLRVPYHWQWPTWQRLGSRAWNREEPRLFVPKAFGWGYGINFARVFRRKPKP